MRAAILNKSFDMLRFKQSLQWLIVLLLANANFGRTEESSQWTIVAPATFCQFELMNVTIQVPRGREHDTVLLTSKTVEEGTGSWVEVTSTHVMTGEPIAPAAQAQLSLPNLSCGSKFKNADCIVKVASATFEMTANSAVPVIVVSFSVPTLV
jgi:hypothetical protein